MKKSQETDGKRMYEGMFILKASTASKDWNRASGEVRKLIEAREGEMVFFEKWDERKFTFELRRQNKGVYVLTYFRMPPGEVDTLRREVELSSIVLRVLVLSSSGPPAPEEPAEEASQEAGKTAGAGEGKKEEEKKDEPKKEEKKDEEKEEPKKDETTDEASASAGAPEPEAPAGGDAGTPEAAGTAPEKPAAGGEAAT